MIEQRHTCVNMTPASELWSQYYNTHRIHSNGVWTKQFSADTESEVVLWVWSTWTASASCHSVTYCWMMFHGCKQLDIWLASALVPCQWHLLNSMHLSALDRVTPQTTNHARQSASCDDLHDRPHTHHQFTSIKHLRPNLQKELHNKIRR